MATAPLEMASLHAVVAAYADNPSAFLALNAGNAHFTAPGLDGVVVYRRSGRYLVQFGAPFGPDRAALLHAFTGFARVRRRRVVAVQVQQSDVDLYAARGYTVNQIGASYAVSLADFTLRGSRFVRLRNKISRATRGGLVVAEVAQPEWAAELAALDGEWLRSKGRHAKQLEFLVGEHGGPAQAHRRLFVGTIAGELAGYISYSPAYGSRPGWLHDLSRRRPSGPPGVMEAINATAIEAFRAEGAAWLHFGFTPFTGLSPDHEHPRASRWFRRLVGLLSRHGAAVYPAATQLAYKAKWAPHAVLPEYVAFSNGASPLAFLHVFRASNAL
ncbi:phosphatidylglycerol lysyltransferase domain-containing protein [Actinophytocola sp.]|uniref:phosphatidylglycerol lysyltransferase domain-containing protein n=1 Tax=Actinophytocola sp. TaxID=1872138 RepID=UPI003D6A0D3D